MSKKKNWIMGICSSAGNGVYLSRIQCTQEDILEHLMSQIQADKYSDLNIWDHGTESIDELIRYEDGSYNGYNSFNYYHVEYTVIEEMPPSVLLTVHMNKEV